MNAGEKLQSYFDLIYLEMDKGFIDPAYLRLKRKLSEKLQDTIVAINSAEFSHDTTDPMIIDEMGQFLAKRLPLDEDLDAILAQENGQTQMLTLFSIIQKDAMEHGLTLSIRNGQASFTSPGVQHLMYTIAFGF